MDHERDLYFVNEKEVSVNDLNQKIFSSALFYGTGCFETMRFQNGRICRFEEHLDRLIRGLDYLQLPKHLYPDRVFLREKINYLIDSNTEGGLFKIRLQCSLLENNGYRLDSDVELLSHIRISDLQVSDKPIKLLTAKTRVIPSLCRPADLKLSNMLHYRTAYREAIYQSYDDALMLTTDGFIAETSMANLFWVNENRVFTPSEDCAILPGIMREETIQAIRNRGKLSIEEGIYNKESILNAELVWVSNSVVEMRPVISIDNTKLNYSENLLKEIKATIQDLNRTSSKQ